jgi:hypothetical protein
MTSAAYYIYQNGKQSGPYSLENLQAYWREGTITEQSYYWTDGMADWGAITDLAPQLSDGTEHTGAADGEAPTHFLFENGTQTGPFTLERLKERYQNGEVSGSTFFWREGMESWKPLREIANQLRDQPRQVQPQTDQEASAEPAAAHTGADAAPEEGTAAAEEQAMVEGPFSDIVRKDMETFGQGPISPYDSDGPFYEISPDGKTRIRMSLAELRYAFQAGHFAPDLPLKREEQEDWGKLEDLQEQLA